ncbi:cyclic nucleotide-binding domain-containing protein [archaeon]|nr:MAG: cyclic nucleotide-binding domain-containing protein [archaeon]
MNEKRKKEAEERTPIASPPSSNNGAVSDVSSISKQVDKSEKHRLKEEIQVEREQVDNSSEPRLATVVEPLENTPHSRPASWHYWLTHMCSRCSKSLVFIKPLHPDSKYKHNWEIIMFSICIYYAIVIPLRLAFTLPSWLFWIDYLFDLVNLFDCYLAATSLGEYHAGQVLMTADGIFRRYYRTRFLVDVFLILPYDLLALLHFVLPPKIHMFLRAILRFPKLAKLWYLSQYYMRVEKACIDSNINYTTVRVVSITTAVIIIGHWVACGWMMTASYNFVGSCSTSADYLNCQYLGTWVEQQYLSGKLPKDGGDDWSRYIRSINWAIPTLTSEIIGDIFPFNTNESLFTFIVIFCGLSINGAIIGSIVSLVSDSNIEQTKHYRNIETLREYLTRKQVPNDLIQSNIGFLQYLATENGMLTMLRDEVFSSLPHSIKISIDQEMKTLPYLRQCPFFDFFPDELLRGISARLRTRMYCKNDKIINYGDLGHEMFFLEKGKVDIVSADGRTVFATLEEGSFFGETAIFFKVTRAATVRAASPFCVCLVLAKEDLNQELRSLEFDEIEILNIFKRLQVSNQRRNAAIEMNLKYSLVQTHKLSKLIKRAGGDDTSSSTAFRIRKILTPESLFRVLWDFAGLVFLIYFTFSIPMYIAFFFGSDVELYTKRVIYEVFISFYWLLDMVLKLKYFSYYSDLVSQKLVTDPDLIWLHYFNTLEFKLDLLASIPFELLILSPNMSYTTVFMIRAIHLLKIPQIPVYISLFENHVRRLLAIHIGRTTSLIVKAGLAYIVLSHWLACGFFMIHRYAEINHDVTYVIADKLADYHPVTGRHNICNTAIRYCYARSMYFVIGTMTSVGYGDISPYTNDEIMFEQAVAILGAYIAAIFLGYCGTFQADQDSSGHRGFVKGLAKLEAFVKYRRLPGYLHSAIITQYTYIYKKTNSLDGDNNLLLQKLSEPSQMELSLYMNEEIMNSVPIFSEAAAPLRRRLAARLRPQVTLMCFP